MNDTSFGLYSPTSFLKDPLMQDISFSTNPSIPVSSTPIVAHASLPSQLATSTPAVTVSPAANMKAETREVVLYHRCTEPQLSLTCQCFNCAKQVGDCNQRFKERSTNDFKCDTLSSCKSLLHSLVSIYFFFVLCTKFLASLCPMVHKSFCHTRHIWHLNSLLLRVCTHLNSSALTWHRWQVYLITRRVTRHPMFTLHWPIAPHSTSLLAQLKHLHFPG